ncbi:putative bifunctional diguanylate cyclase/phosphodiesterase [Beggiatoa leptomitoformis]|uniref:cyclic-guanylate-specific phosphodiesterase n=1 Tax=Beggiatoa leptomitoformis TaxID=288004 RepID=A0A2N9YHP2_9GAMM|nr:GGDEF and EAL domain-containing protein [Beggiatoa leptomitoformis]AUI69919.1 EAL domain-containing protein [Beggiatoa leptomitoformis]QGX03662.1 EAL domain-containing protein [Beggiatoa leptomitoformis]
MRILLIEKDGQDYLKLRQLVDEQDDAVTMEWAPNHENAVRLIKKNNYTIFLVAFYDESQQSFIDWLYEYTTSPIIFLIKSWFPKAAPRLDSLRTEYVNKTHVSWALIKQMIHHFETLRQFQETGNKFLSAFMQATTSLCLLNPQGTIIEINENALTFVGLSYEEVVNAPAWDIPWNKLTEKLRRRFHVAIRIARRAKTLKYEVNIKGQGNNKPITLEVAVSPITNSTGNVVWILVETHDLSAYKLAEQQLLQASQSDQLTGLPNRHFFLERLERAMLNVQGNKNYRIAVLYIDLDRFRVVNESLGPDMGDWLIMEIALRLQNCLPTNGFLARSGGDEFMILLDELSNLSDAIRLARTINQEVAQAFLLDGYEVQTSASIGIAYSTYHQSSNDLLRDADIAMYRAKAGGKSCYSVFNSNMHAEAMSRLQIEAELNRGIEQNNFVLVYQPQIELQSKELLGMESLVRFYHPQYGLMSPLRFIPILEDTGIIIKIGEWIIQTAVHQFKTWQDAGLPLKHVAVNLSATQFRNKHLLDSVREALEKSGLSAECLELELTESLLLEDTNSAVKTLKQFKDMGIRVTIDDFGTGYSSLSYLRRFPVDSLKIDKSFIKGIISEPEDIAITVATIDMAHALGLSVIAEGVETVEQRDFLRDHGCDCAQGYYYSQPLNHEEFAKWTIEYEKNTHNDI